MSTDEKMILEGILPLGQRWVFWGDALGSTVDFSAGYYDGDLTVPSAPEDPYSRGVMGHLHAPPWLGDVNPPPDWGEIVGMPMRLSLVGALGIRVQLPRPPASVPVDREQLGNQAMHFAQTLFPWLRRLYVWLSAIVGADLTTESPDDLPGSAPSGLRLRARGDSEWALQHEDYRSWNYSTGQAINLVNWRRAVRLSSSDTELPIEHSLLNAARAALEQRNTRIAAIEAGTAAEVALSQAIRAKVKAAKEDVAVLDLKTLGQLPGLARKYKVDCPDKAEFDKLLKPRNESAHGTRSPWYPEAREAIRVAMQIVNLHSPLPP